jgi:hypothetical protein
MTRRLTRLLVPLALCIAAVGWSASAAQAARGMEVALFDDNVFVRGIVGTPFKGIDRAKELHTTWIRANLTWTAVLGKKQSRAKKQPKHVKYRWRPWDDLVKRAARKGIAVELTVVGPAPRWASGNHKIGVFKPNARKFGAFARATARHFKGKVTRYSIWSEPNLFVWLAPARRAPRLYRSLYVQGYKNIKAVSKKNQVLIGETAPYGQRKRTIAPLKFLRGVTCVNSRYKHRRCPPLRTDGYAHHPYDYKHRPTYRYPGRDNVTISTLGRLTSALSKLKKAKALTTPRGGTPFVYLTEYGYFSGYKYKVSRKKQAAYLKKAFTIARKNKRVKQMLQYLLGTPPKKLGFFQTNIMNRKLTPYLAFKTLKSWAAKEYKSGGIARKPSPVPPLPPPGSAP